jgi:hypothetical protein
MKSESVELHLPGGHGAAVSRPTEPATRLGARGYTFTTEGGARR